MTWWGWIIIGFGLLALELMVPLDFFLVFIGAGFVVTGIFTWFGVLSVAWTEWVAAGVFSLAFLLFLRRPLKRHLTKASPGHSSSLVGKSVRIIADIPTGESGRGEAQGTTWSVRNESAETLVAGEQYQVAKRDGLILIIE